MSLDFNDLLISVAFLKELLLTNEEEIQNQKSKLCAVFKKNKILEDENRSLSQDIFEVNTVIGDLQKAILVLSNYEAENKILSMEKIKLENYLTEIEKSHKNEVEELKCSIDLIKQQQQNDTSLKVQEVQNEASLHSKKYERILEEKDGHIACLIAETKELQETQMKNLLKQKLEFEDKISRLKSQPSKTKGSCNCQSFQSDVFRKKYTKLEKETKEIITAKNKVIDELKLQISQLKYQNNISHSASENNCNGQAVQAVSKDIKIGNMLVGESRFERTIVYDDEYAIRHKRRCTDVNLKDNSKNCFPTYADSVKSVKKKLFNVDLNYLQE